MTTYTIPFCGVPMGTTFFDPSTCRRYVKVDHHLAELETQGDWGNPVLERFDFEPLEMVRIRSNPPGEW
jgi:hypothetical protein